MCIRKYLSRVSLYSLSPMYMTFLWNDTSNPMFSIYLREPGDGTFPCIMMKVRSMIIPCPQKGIWIRAVPIEFFLPPIRFTDLCTFFMIIGFVPKVEQYDLYRSSHTTDMLVHVFIFTPEKRWFGFSIICKYIFISIFIYLLELPGREWRLIFISSTISLIILQCFGMLNLHRRFLILHLSPGQLPGVTLVCFLSFLIVKYLGYIFQLFLR